jgi:hypothetical protein
MRSRLRASFPFIIAACFAIAPAYSTEVLNLQTMPHLEKCMMWDYREDRFGATNNCKETVAIQFMLMSTQRTDRREIKAGEVFDTGLSRGEIDDGGWLFTACPLGYAPSVPFLLKDGAVLLLSLYDCVMK